MTDKTIEILDNLAHAHLRILPAISSRWLPSRQIEQIAPSEILEAAREYPVFLTKCSQTGQFQFSVILGLYNDENLYLDEDGVWRARYIPLNVRRNPFGLGVGANGSGDGPVITIDMASARLSSEEGAPIFLEQGGFAPSLGEMQEVLGRLVVGVDQTRALVNQLLEFDLIEPVQIELKLANQTKLNFEALYSVNEDKLRELDDQSIGQLNRMGVLKYIHLLGASVSNMQSLIHRKNAQIEASDK